MSGLGWTPPYIAGIIAFAGMFQAFWLLVLMPILDKRVGTQKLTSTCFAIWPAFFAAPILANQLARRALWEFVYTVMVMAQFTGAGVSMAFSELLTAFACTIRPADTLSSHRPTTPKHLLSAGSSRPSERCCTGSECSVQVSRPNIYHHDLCFRRTAQHPGWLFCLCVIVSRVHLHLLIFVC